MVSVMWAASCSRISRTVRSALSVLADEDVLVEESADIFARFEPVTALDIVQQVPGFRLDYRQDFATTRVAW